MVKLWQEVGGIKNRNAKINATRRRNLKKLCTDCIIYIQWLGNLLWVMFKQWKDHPTRSLSKIISQINLYISTVFLIRYFNNYVRSTGQCLEIFCFRFFSWIIFPQAPENKIRVISNFFQKFAESQCAAPVPKTLVANLPPVSTTICRLCQLHRWKNQFNPWPFWVVLRKILQWFFSE